MGQAPDPQHLALMSDLAGRTLSMALGLVQRTRDGKTARLVLTGDGGGEWLSRWTAAASAPGNLTSR